MGNSLEELEPIRITRDLKGKFSLIYGQPKTGKTTLFSKFPKSLLLAFEPGYNALNNVFVKPILSWVDFKVVIKELASKDVKEKFHNIGIDTADIAWTYCETYICQQNEVQTLGDVPYGKAYEACKREYADCFRKIANMGYGITFISHATEKTLKNEKGEEYVQISPALPARPYDVVNKLVDNIGYIHAIRDVETKESKNFLFFRGNEFFVAGSRFKHMVGKIELSYDNFVNALHDAIDKQAAEGGMQASTEGDNLFMPKEKRKFVDTMAEAKALWVDLTANNSGNALTILGRAEKIFGKPVKLSEIPESQQDLLELVILEMKEI